MQELFCFRRSLLQHFADRNGIPVGLLVKRDEIYSQIIFQQERSDRRDGDAQRLIFGVSVNPEEMMEAMDFRPLLPR